MLILYWAHTICQSPLCVFCYEFIHLNQDFSISALLTFGARSFFIVENCHVHCRMFSGILRLCSLADNSKLLSPDVTNKNIFRHCQKPMGSTNFPHLRSTDLNPETTLWSTYYWLLFWNTKMFSKFLVRYPKKSLLCHMVKKEKG